MIAKIYLFMRKINTMLSWHRLLAKITCLFVFASLFCSCKFYPKYVNAHQFSIKEIPFEKTLNGKILTFNEPIMPAALSVVDSVLILLNINSVTNFLVHKYNLNSMEKIGESVSIGNGPGEMLSVWKIQITDSSVWLLDRMKRIVNKYEISDFCFSDHPILEHTIQFTSYVDDISVLSDHEIVAMIAEPYRGRLILFDMEGNQLFENGEIPDDGTKKHPIEKAKGAVCYMVTNPLDKRIGLVYMSTDLIEIYDTEANLLKQVHGPDQFFPHFKVHNSDGGTTRVGTVKGKAREAYYSPVGFNNEIWALYSGKYDDPKDIHLHLIDTIIVFDWDGNPLRYYKLDMPVFKFTIDEQNNKIYAISDSPDFNIIEFDL